MNLTVRRTKTEAEAPTTVETVDLVDERPFPGYVRVNLIPESIRTRQRVARIRRWIIVLLVLVVLILGALFVLAQRDIAAAEQRLSVAQTEQIQLQGQVAQYAEVPAVFAVASRGQEALTTAMSREVRWAFLLNQLSFSTPAGVTLDSVSGALTEGGPVLDSPGGVLPPKESVGTMTFSGTGSAFSEVAAWLDSLETLQDYAYPFLTNSSKATGTGTGSGQNISWESNADLSRNALSGRYGTPPPATTEADGGTTTPSAPSPAPVPQPGG